jgi:hypothetical protein
MSIFGQKMVVEEIVRFGQNFAKCSQLLEQVSQPRILRLQPNKPNPYHEKRPKNFSFKSDFNVYFNESQTKKSR